LLFAAVVAFGVLVLLFFARVLMARSRSLEDCPDCHSQRVRPSYPRFGDQLMAFLWVRPYRCESCRHRFYGPWRSRSGTAQE
jgi:hypothetical protein